MTELNSNLLNQDSEGSIALRDFFTELFVERDGDDDLDSRGSDVDSDSVSLSSDEETAVDTVGDLRNSTNLKNSMSNELLNSSTNHTRRRRFRRTRGLKAQRLQYAVSPDNARGVRTRNMPFRGELTVSSYHNRPGSTTSLGNVSSRKQPLSASAHSLGSRTGISNTSVNNWRHSLHKRQSTIARKNHRDTRWATLEAPPKNNFSNQSLDKSYDFGFVNDSLHQRTTLRRKEKKASFASVTRDSSNKTVQRDNKSFSLAGSCTRAIESAVRVVNSVSSDESDSGGEEFYEDDEVSLSSFTDSFVSSRVTDSFVSSLGGSSFANASNTFGSSLNFGSRYKTKAKALPSYSSRVAPSRTKSGSDVPRLPRRTRDDSFSFEDSETFEPLKGSEFSDEGFQKAKVRRSLSDDVSITFAHLLSKTFKPVGRWDATVTRQDPDSPNKVSSTRCPALPRRIPSISTISGGGSKHKIQKRSTGRYSNHSNDSSEPDSDSECSLGSFVGNSDGSLTSPTMDTTESSSKGSSSKSRSAASLFQSDRLKIVLPSSSHSRRMQIPESLRKLPQESFSSRGSRGSRHHPGKSLRTTSQLTR